MKLSWKPVTILEIVLTVGTAAYYLWDPADFLGKVVPPSQITTLSENVLRLMATTILTQSAMLIYSLRPSVAVSAKKMLYVGMTVGDFGLLVAYYYWFYKDGVHSIMSAMPLVFSFLFGVFRILTFFNPSWWSWEDGKKRK